VLAAEVAVTSADADALGLALARILAVSDRVLARSRPWLRGGAWREALEEGETSRGAALLDRYHDALGELDVAVPGEDDETETPKRGGFRRLFARRGHAAPASAVVPATAPTGTPR